jgi:hypothetical protein
MMTPDGRQNHNISAGQTSELDLTWKRWREAARASMAPEKYPYFNLSGGGDPLHLSRHGFGSGDSDPDAFLAIESESSRRAVFISSDMNSWHGNLAVHANSLPDHGDHWYIEVVVRPVGSLGVFRKSRQTGLWFSGQHRYHSPGN